MTTARAEKFAAIRRPVPACRIRTTGLRKPWTDAEDDLLRRSYDGTWQAIERVALATDRTYTAVKHHARTLGLVQYKKTPPWTPEEDAKLEEWVGQHPPTWMHQHLPGRTLVAITVRLKRLRLSRRARDGWYTMREVCELLGVDHKWVRGRIEHGDLKAERHFGEGGTHGPLGQYTWHIDAADLRGFVLRYLGEFTGRNVDLVGLVELLGVRR